MDTLFITETLDRIQTGDRTQLEIGSGAMNAKVDVVVLFKVKVR